MSHKLISICIPVYNEEDNITFLYTRLCQLAAKEKSYVFEFLFTDNHSEDKTFEKLAKLAAQDARIRIIRFSRNFGFQKSIMTNYLNARGNAAVQIDCDLQDPPELISDFLRKWEQGYKVVYGIRKSRPESAWLRTGRKIFYRLVNFLSKEHLPPDAGDFRLIDKCIIDELRKINDTQPYLRGLIATMGFKQSGIAYNRDARNAGSSKFNLCKLFSLAFDGILQHSIAPLRAVIVIGFIIFIFSLLGAIYYLIARLSFHSNWPQGLASSSILILFSLGINAIFLGIIGEYVGRIYKNVKQEPFTIIEHVVDNMENQT
jgi:dolichol-phosphate mannosyltransferase